jgi:hypothetical protein
MSTMNEKQLVKYLEKLLKEIDELEIEINSRLDSLHLNVFEAIANLESPKKKAKKKVRKK